MAMPKTKCCYLVQESQLISSLGHIASGSTAVIELNSIILYQQGL